MIEKTQLLPLSIRKHKISTSFFPYFFIFSKKQTTDSLFLFDVILRKNQRAVFSAFFFLDLFREVCVRICSQKDPSRQATVVL